MMADVNDFPVDHLQDDHALPPRLSIVTRFGEKEISQDRILTFDNGIIGFHHVKHYTLIDIANGTVPFKLLQAIDEPKLGFIVLPLDGKARLYREADLERALDELDLHHNDVALLAIVTLRPKASRVDFTMNLRAPLLIDVEHRLGRQYVFADEAYSLHHALVLPERHEVEHEALSRKDVG